MNNTVYPGPALPGTFDGKDPYIEVESMMVEFKRLFPTDVSAHTLARGNELCQRFLHLRNYLRGWTGGTAALQRVDPTVLADHPWESAFRTLTRDDSTPSEIDARMELRSIIWNLAQNQRRPQPKLLGWRMSDYTNETADVNVARNWCANVPISPIFEGDPNTKLTQPLEP